tara:strand:- start:61 stop:258 length:198 start_codon:yes stop_codon:yes gene_type:complete
VVVEVVEVLIIPDHQKVYQVQHHQVVEPVEQHLLVMLDQLIPAVAVVAVVEQVQITVVERVDQES